MKNAAIFLLALFLAVHAVAQSRRLLLGGPPRSSGAFNPANFGTVHLDHDASAVTGLSDGGTTNRWIDTSGNQFHAYQLLSLTPPVWRASGLNGSPAFEFGGNGAVVTNGFAASNCLSSLSSATLFVAMKNAAISVNFNYDGSPFHGGGSGQLSAWPFSAGLTIYDDFGSTVRYAVGTSSRNLTNNVVVCVVAAANDYRFYVDNVLVYSTAISTVGWDSAPSIGYDGETFILQYNGMIGRMIIMNGALSTQNRTNLNNGLAAIYGAQIN